MSRALEISEVVGVFELQGQPAEVCAVASGRFDDGASQLELTLDAFIRPVDLLHKERHERPPWLPARQVVREGVSWEESSQLAKEIFHRWVSRVRGSIPALVNT